MPTKKKVILTSIDTAPERMYIEIDGKNYGVVTADELELKDLLYLQRARTRIQGGIDESTDEDVDVLSGMLDRMTRIILFDTPDEVHAKLKDMHRLEIISSFTAAGRPLPVTEPMTNESIPDESQPSQDSLVAEFPNGVTLPA